MMIMIFATNEFSEGIEIRGIVIYVISLHIQHL